MHTQLSFQHFGNDIQQYQSDSHQGVNQRDSMSAGRQTRTFSHTTRAARQKRGKRTEITSMMRKAY